MPFAVPESFEMTHEPGDGADQPGALPVTATINLYFDDEMAPPAAGAAPALRPVPDVAGGC